MRNACAVVEIVAERQPLGGERAGQADRNREERSPPSRRDPAPRWMARPDQRRPLADRRCMGRFARRAATAALAASMRPRMETLRDRTGETVMLVAIDHARLTVHEVVESLHPLRITTPVGSELPLVGSSAARVIAAHSPPAELAARCAEPILPSTMTRRWPPSAAAAGR